MEYLFPLFISNINPVETEKVSDSVYHLVVAVEGVGTVPSVKRFIQKLEQTNPAMSVQGAELRSQGPEVNELRYKFTIVKLGLKEQS